MRPARMTDIGTVTCHRCGRLVGVLRAELSFSPRVAPRLHWASDGRRCRCPTTRLPLIQALPPSVRTRVARALEVSSNVEPWEEVAVPQPIHLRA